jgi:hypothetical protein
VQLGGICADKTGYHDERNGQLGNYSATLPIDLLGPGDTCSGLDLTMSTGEMIKRSNFLKNACLDPLDDRTGYIREWIGTLNGTTVTCYIHDTESSVFRLDTGRDSTHLWHIHLSFFRKYSDLARAGEAIASVLSGETYAAWRARINPEPAPVPIPVPPTPPLGDTMFAVKEKSTTGVRLSNGVNSRNDVTWPVFLALHAAGLIQIPKAGVDSSGFVLVVPDGEIDMYAGPLSGPLSDAPEPVDIAALAAAIVAGLPTTPLTKADVEAAVRAAFANGLA